MLGGSELVIFENLNRFFTDHVKLSDQFTPEDLKIYGNLALLDFLNKYNSS